MAATGARASGSRSALPPVLCDGTHEMHGSVESGVLAAIQYRQSRNPGIRCSIRIRKVDVGSHRAQRVRTKEVGGLYFKPRFENDVPVSLRS